MFNKLELGETILVARAFEPAKFAPQHAIWFQRKGNVQAYVSRVNDQYKIEIYKVLSDKSGKLLIEDYEETLPLARKAVFQYFDNHVVEAGLKFTPEMEAVIMELPIFKLLALGDSTVYAASKAQKEAKRKEANKSQKENVEKKKEATAPKKPVDPNAEMVKNPNPEGREKEVTKEAADKWNRENGKGGAEKPAAKPEEKPEPKKEEKPEDKHAEQVKESGEAAQNIMKDLGPKQDAPAPAPKSKEEQQKEDDEKEKKFLDSLEGPPEEKPDPEDELSEDDKLADEQGYERPSFQEGKKLTREERKQMKEAQEQHKKDHPDEYEDEPPKTKPKPQPEAEKPKVEEPKTEAPAPAKEAKPDEAKPADKPKPVKDEDDEDFDFEPKEAPKPMTPEEHKTKAQKLVDSKEFEKMKPEDQSTIKDFLKNPTPESADKIAKILKSQEPAKQGGGGGWKKDDYSLRDLTETEEGKNWFDTLEEMYKEFKSELGV